MKSRSILLLTFLIVLLFCTSDCCIARYSGGTGDPCTPYKIDDFNDLMALRADSNDWDKCFILTADIDMNPNVTGEPAFTTALISPDTSDSLGFHGTPFTGVFDGNDCTIRNLTISTNGLGNDYLGLFGQIGTGAEVKNLGIEGSSIKSDGYFSVYIGGLCGENRQGTISKCYAAGSVSGGDRSCDLGGLCGYNSGTVSNCYAKGSVSGGNLSRSLGGLCGYNTGTISNCYATGNVSSGNDSKHIGGLCGYTWPVTISNCFWDKQSGVMRISDDGIGLTTNQMMDINTYLNAGWDFVDESANGNEDIWQISDGDYPSLSWQIINDTPVPDIRGIGIDQAQIDLINAGYRLGNVRYIYSDSVNADLIIYSVPEAGVYAVQGSGVNVYVSIGPSSYSGGGAGTLDDPIRIGNASDLLLLGETPSDYDKCFILTADIDLDPNVTGVPAFTTALIAPDTSDSLGFQGTTFTGDFDGNNHKILNLTINTAGLDNEYLGLFGFIGWDGEVKNLGVEGVSVTGGDNSRYIGGLCGINDGSILDCYVTGGVTGGDYSEIIGGLCGYNRYGTILKCYVAGSATGGNYSEMLGGLCGENRYGTILKCYVAGSVTGGNYSRHLGGLCGYNDGRISNCYAKGSVTGKDNSRYLGGLCGWNEYIISNCYSTGDVSGNDVIGGLVGHNFYYHRGARGTITNCYSTGKVSQAITRGGLVGLNTGFEHYSFWDIETSDCVRNDGGTGLTTAQMQSPNTYLNAGWDFVEESANGDEDIWQIFDGDYPCFSWQIGNDTPVPNVIGRVVAQAKDSLIDAGYQLGSIRYAYNDSIPEGLITSQVPAEGVYAVQGRAVYIVVSLGPSPYSGGGTGKQDDPFRIGDFNDLMALRANSNDWDKCFILTADIDMDPNETGLPAFTTALIAPDNNNLSDGFQGTAFIGDFDGNNHKIMNLTINTTGLDNDYLGLFGFIGWDGEVKNLGVKGVSITGGNNSCYLGGLCAENYKATISNCYATGSITDGNDSDFIGGLCGYNWCGTISDSYAKGNVTGGDDSYNLGGLCGYNDRGTISNCYTEGNVSGDVYLGGLCGKNQYGTISNCYAEGSVSGGGSLGGLCGKNDFHSTISNCYATGSVTGDGYLGGLCGYSYGTISNCYSTGSVSSGSNSWYLGGLCGYNGGTISICYAEGSVSGGSNSWYLGGLCGKNDSHSTISNCYATGSVTCGSNSRYVGGLCGENHYKGTISNCYSTGNVSGGNNSWYLGGLVGYDYIGSYEFSFWNSDVNPALNGIGNAIDPNVIGITTEQMYDPNTYLSEGWDFAGESDNGTEDIWFIKGVDYPRFCYMHRPVAKAGEDQEVCAWVDGYALVVLDGSGSSDPDGDELSYWWTWEIDGTVYEAEGMEVEVELAAGEYDIGLVVSDGILDSEPSYVKITVIESIETIVVILPKTINTHSKGPKLVTTGIELPFDIEPDEVDTGQPLILYPGEIESTYQKVWRYGSDQKKSILGLFDKSELLEGVSENGPVELTVVGQLKTGQYIFGTDTVIIRQRK
jgi:hypothetical protein